MTSVWASESAPSHVTAREEEQIRPRGLSWVMRHRLGDT